MGSALYRLERYEEALAAYTRATELAPEDAAYHNNRGLALSKLDRYEDKLGAYTRAAELAPEEAVYHNNRGNALYSLERYEEALAAYTRATELAPEERGLPQQPGSCPMETGPLRGRARGGTTSRRAGP